MQDLKGLISNMSRIENNSNKHIPSFIAPRHWLLLSQWDGYEARNNLIICIPMIVGLIWIDGLTDLKRIAELPMLELIKSEPNSMWNEDKTDGLNQNWCRLLRCLRYSTLEFGCSQLVTALLYVRRLKLYHLQNPRGQRETFFDRQHCCQRSGQFEFTVFLASLLLSNKYCVDVNVGNMSWARLIGVPVETINQMEMDALLVLRHDLFVKPEEYNEWLVCVEFLLHIRVPPSPPPRRRTSH